jgi:hypothetical protein
LGDTWSALLGEQRREDATVPKTYPEEFREDVVRVVRTRSYGVTLE